MHSTCKAVPVEERQCSMLQAQVEQKAQSQGKICPKLQHAPPLPSPPAGLLPQLPAQIQRWHAYHAVVAWPAVPLLLSELMSQLS